MMVGMRCEGRAGGPNGEEAVLTNDLNPNLSPTLSLALKFTLS